MNKEKPDTINIPVSDTSIRAGGDISIKGLEVVTTVATVLSAAGGMKMLFEMVKLWVEDRRERKIKLRKGDVELELQGSMSQKEIEQKIKLFQELTRDAKADVKLIIPPD